MDWNIVFPAFIGLIGVAVGFLLNLWRDKILKDKELQQKELEYQRDYTERYLIIPIITGIDRLLSTMDKFCWIEKTGNLANASDTLDELKDEGGTIRARIIALNDELLQDMYNEFIHVVMKFLADYIQGKFVENDQAISEVLRDARQNAGVIFDRLKPKLIKN